MCGEHSAGQVVALHGCGSSPRVRGTPHESPNDGVRRRFIPACAGNTCRRSKSAKWWSVHPRVCGEHRWAAPFAETVIGSSPRVRGTRHAERAGSATVRFIPACAGNTPRSSRRNRPSTVHPRVCGEHLVEIARTNPDAGSSPRVRGTRATTARAALSWRFIPACAGNTAALRNGRGLHPVHPRVCGEHRISPSCPATSRGSSPRVRGTHGARMGPPPWRRFIPACAGNTPVWIPGPRRLCGSSPRVRGTLHLRGREVLRKRFIPACAGNTRAMIARGAAWTVHPRVCGEHVYPSAKLLSEYGSSPRVRGTRVCGSCIKTAATVHPRVCGEHRRKECDNKSQDGSSPRVRGTPGTRAEIPRAGRFIPACAGNTLVMLCVEVRGNGSSPRVRGTLPPLPPSGRLDRFIPACAGNTAHPRWTCLYRPVHPRVCGEHFPHCAGVIGGSGSSPRVRGTPASAPAICRRRRFIPACAGNTTLLLTMFCRETVHPRVCGEHIVSSAGVVFTGGSSPRVRGTP